MVVRVFGAELGEVVGNGRGLCCPFHTDTCGDVDWCCDECVSSDRDPTDGWWVRDLGTVAHRLVGPDLSRCGIAARDWRTVAGTMPKCPTCEADEDRGTGTYTVRSGYA